jgi:hypothetical protein
MPQLSDRDQANAQVVMPTPYVEYLVLRREDAWFIVYDGAEYGPYNSSREAMLFAVDVAHKLGERGKGTRVLMMDSTGRPCATWTFGVDSYPPRL